MDDSQLYFLPRSSLWGDVFDEQFGHIIVTVPTPPTRPAPLPAHRTGSEFSTHNGPRKGYLGCAPADHMHVYVWEVELMRPIHYRGEAVWSTRSCARSSGPGSRNCGPRRAGAS